MIRITAAQAKLRLTSGDEEVQNSREIASPKSSFQPRRNASPPEANRKLTRVRTVFYGHE